MGLLKKKPSSAETIDFTMLQKRGILQRARAMRRVEQSARKELELTNSSTLISQETTTADRPFSFLDNLASAASTTSSPQLNKDSSAEVSTLRVKLDDLEYKLERLVEKLGVIESKLEAFERKVS